MVLLAFSAMLSAFGVEVLAFSLAEAEGGVRKAPGLASGRTVQPKMWFCGSAPFSEVQALGLSRGSKVPHIKLSMQKESHGGGGRSLELFKHLGQMQWTTMSAYLQYLQELPEEPDPLRLQGDLLKG